MFKWFRHLHGYRVGVRSPRYEQEFTTSRFCLAPPGAGWGKRGILSVLMGCVPVVIGDGIHQAFEPQLDWGRFAVRVAEADIPRLPYILAGLSEEEVQAKQVGQAGAAAHKGGRAVPPCCSRLASPAARSARRPEHAVALRLRPAPLPQAALRCASLHLRWSSILGGSAGEDGRFDAFATLMQILRVKAQQPELKPEEYYEKDEAFRWGAAGGRRAGRRAGM